VKILGWLVVFAVLVALAMKALERPNDLKISAARDTMRIISVQRDTVRDTIRVRESARQRWDTIVRNVSDTQVVIQREKPDTVTLPVEVIQRDRAKDSLLASLYVDRGLDSLWHIQDAKLPHKPASKWSVGMTGGYGCNTKGCGPSVTLGVSWRP
jgi:hypothetical protein